MHKIPSFAYKYHPHLTRSSLNRKMVCEHQGLLLVHRRHQPGDIIGHHCVQKLGLQGLELAEALGLQEFLHLVEAMMSWAGEKSDAFIQSSGKSRSSCSSAVSSCSPYQRHWASPS